MRREDFKQGLQNALHSVQLSEREHAQMLQEIVSEGKMKRKLFGSVVLTVLIVLLGIGVVYALFQSQVQALLGRFYGEDDMYRLEEGKIANVDEVFQLGDVDFYFQDAVVKGNNIYIAATARTKKENDLLYEGEQDTIRDGIPSRIVDILPNKIGLSEEHMLDISRFGLNSTRDADGSLQILVESDVVWGLGEGDRYILEAELSVREPGQGWKEGMHKTVKVSLKPTEEIPRQEQSDAQREAEVKRIEHILKHSNVVPDVPAEYRNGNLPIYAAKKKDFTAIVKPEMFNTGSVWDRYGNTCYYYYADESTLDVGKEFVFYRTNHGKFNYGSEGETSIGPKESLEAQILGLGQLVLAGYDGSFPHAVQKELYKITLTDALTRAEKLLQDLQLEYYNLTSIAAMNVERIHSLGTIMLQHISEGRFDSAFPAEYMQAGEEQEGFYLHYQVFGMEDSNEDSYISLYITHKGIAAAQIMESHQKGELISADNKLADIDSILADFVTNTQKIPFLSNPEMRIQSVKLVYGMIRKGETAEYRPIWQVKYRECTEQNYESCIQFDAIDGSYINSPFLYLYGVEAAETTENSPNFPVNFPEEYRQKGTMPVRSAIERDFRRDMQPEYFNQSGVSAQDESEIRYQDESVLQISPELLFYRTCKGTFDYGAKYGKEMVLPRESIASQVGSLAASAVHRLPGSGEALQLENKQLEGISLAEAQAKAEELMAKLNMRGYRLYHAIDMSLERIHRLGTELQTAYEEGRYYTNGPMDTLQATKEHEGYYLEYRMEGMEEAGENDTVSTFYITRYGFASASLREYYRPGEELHSVYKLVPVETIADALPGVLAKAKQTVTTLRIKSASLNTMPVLQKSGVELQPVWHIRYTTNDSMEFEEWANFSAIDGKLLSAIFD